MSDSEALESFTNKWRARWPEWNIAEVFVPHDEREVAVAWFALLQELTDAAWSGEDARPGEAKLLWWQEELLGWSQGRRRHPLGIALQRLSPSWAVLSAALPALRQSRERSRDVEEAFATLRPFAEAVIVNESALFASNAEVGESERVTTSLLAEQVSRMQRAAVPLLMLAQSASQSDDVATSAWIAQLQSPNGSTNSSPRVRRIATSIQRGRLQQADSTRPLSRWRTLWLAWRAAQTVGGASAPTGSRG